MRRIRTFASLLAFVLAAGPLSAAVRRSAAWAELLGAAPASARSVAVAAPPAAPAPALAPAAAIPPGTGLSPAIDDPGRVTLILRIISDVYHGKPLAFPKDGSVFQNRDGTLPAMPAGYYREYTVLPPAGSPATIKVGGKTYAIEPAQGRRGVERLIIGGGAVLYYTPNHYREFIRMEVLR